MSRSPAELLRLFVYSHISDNDLPLHLKEEIPKKWEKYGNFVLFHARSFKSEIWLQQDMKFWLRICDILKCGRLGLKNKIQRNVYRSPNVKIIVGDDNWIVHVDNGIKYTWNVEKSMFSKGNASERHRIGNMNCRGEIVVDLFAGIGYFVLPFIVHAKAETVHACEWNPDAVEALKRNLKLNGVENKCFVHEGDNLHVCPKAVADRVNLGLIPTSERSWRVACEALKPTGGMLHIHGNVETADDGIKCVRCSEMATNLETPSKISLESDRESLLFDTGRLTWKRKQWTIWAVHVLHSLRSILIEINAAKRWVCTIENVHNIKSYAPHVDHLVLDVSVKSSLAARF